MGSRTSIEWADATLNTAYGCTKVSEGCAKCYMFRILSKRGQDPGQPRERRDDLLRKAARALGLRPKIVFLNSMTDTFHPDFSFAQIQAWFRVLQEEAPHHCYVVLTKRSERMLAYYRETGPPPHNVWLGVSVESSTHYARVDALRAVPARVRVLSLEPMLGPMTDIDLTGIHWVIVGGESDPLRPRPMEASWVLSVRDRCAAAGIPFFFKQVGGTARVFGEGGSSAWGGDLLKGRQYHALPREWTDSERPPLAAGWRGRRGQTSLAAGGTGGW